MRAPPGARLAATVLVSVFALAGAGCLGGPAGEAPPGEPSGGLDLNVTWPHLGRDYGYAEANFRVLEGDELVAHFTAPNASLPWDVHSHRDGEVVFHDQGLDQERTVRFTAPANGTYSFMWQAADRPTALRVNFTGTGTLLSYSPDP